MKFKSDIEVQAGLRDGGNDIGTAGQLLSSTGTITNWIDQGDVVAAGATRVLIACKNTSGGTIAKGTPVYQTGNVGATDVIEVAEADALISTGYLPAIGLLETDLINNAFGHVVITGELLNITTDPIDGLTPTTGDTIYLKSGGGLTLTKPTGEGNAIQNLGLVGKVSGGNAGSLTVASIMRQNDVPNLPTGKIWIGDGNTIVSDTVYVDEPNNRVGIGTTSPSTKLHVSGGDIRIDDTEQLQFGAGGVRINNDAAGRMYQRAPLGFYWETNGGYRMVLNSSGNVGIGTTSPSSRLDVLTSSSGPVATLKNTSSIGGSGLDVYGGTGSSSNILTLYDKDSNQRLEVTGEGNVGIGTTSPSQKLDVSGTGRFTDILRSDKFLQIQGAGTTANETIGIGLNITDDFAYVGNDSTTRYLNHYGMGIHKPLQATISGGNGAYLSGYFGVDIFTAGNSRIHVNQTGNVGIGTTNPSARLEVQGTNSNTQAALKVTDSGDSFFEVVPDNNTTFKIGDLDAVGDEAMIVGTFSDITFSKGGTTTMILDSNNKVGIGTTSPAKKLTIGGIGTNNTDGLKIEDPSNIAYGAHYSYNDASSTVEIGGVTNNVLNDCISIARDATRAITINTSENVGIGTTSPSSKLQVNGGVQLANDTTSPSATKAGTFRYYTSGNNSYVDMCMQTGASTYAWVNIVTNSW